MAEKKDDAGRCDICHRGLQDPVSIGYQRGPVCRRKNGTPAVSAQGAQLGLEVVDANAFPGDPFLDGTVELRPRGPAGGPYAAFQKGAKIPPDVRARLQLSRRAAPTRSWSYVLEDRWVVIVDLGTGRTVTNAAEDVLLELGRELSLEGRRVIYRDTDGRWDELLHEGVHFRGFAPIAAGGTYFDAITAAERSKP